MIDMFETRYELFAKSCCYFSSVSLAFVDFSIIAFYFRLLF